jgi:hypothetical protein
MFQITSSFTLCFFSDYEIMKSAKLTPSSSSITIYIFCPFGKEVKYLVMLGWSISFKIDTSLQISSTSNSSVD